MTEQSNGPGSAPERSGGAVASKLRRAGRFIVEKPMAALQIVFFVLVAIVVLQNLESTPIDVLFWTIAALPKLVLIVLSMVVGAVIWELIRRPKN